MLIILGGLPATGKSTIGKKLAEKLNAVYLRIDSIEQAIKETHSAEKSEYKVGPEGYIVAYAIARDNLAIGLSVIADSVNSINLTRTAWRKVAIDAGKPFIEVEFICSDKITHQQRVELREPTVQGQQLPTWTDVLSREYEAWEEEHLIIDTAMYSIIEAVDKIVYKIQKIEKHTY